MTATLGNTTTPTSPTYGWIGTGSELQVADSYTVPAGSGLFSSVSFWASGGGTLKIHGVIWDSSGNVLAFGPGVNTSGGGGSGVGATAWYTDTFASPVFIAAGTTIYIGWQADSAATVYYAYNGNILSPTTEWNTHSGATGQSFAGFSAQSPAGLIAAYATYVPAGVWISPSGAVEPPVAIWCNPGSGPTQVIAVYADKAGVVTRIW